MHSEIFLGGARTIDIHIAVVDEFAQGLNASCGVEMPCSYSR